MEHPTDDVALRDAYGQLERRDASANPDVIPPETLAALANMEITEPERSRLLDVVVANRALLQEYELLRAIAAGRPRASALPPWFALAASLVVVVGAGLLWQTVAQRQQEDLVRGSTSDLLLVTPNADDVVSPGSRLVWRSLPGAISYRAELVSVNGAVLFGATGADTSLVLPPTAAPASRVSVSWVVTARMPGGTYLRSSPRRLGLRP